MKKLFSSLLLSIALLGIFTPVMPVTAQEVESNPLMKQTLTTGWQFINDEWYYCNPDGVMQTGWLWDGTSWYYLASDGVMQTGWIQEDTSWYYLSETGFMQTGWVDGGTAFCDSTGRWIPNYTDNPVPTITEQSETERHIRTNLVIIGNVTEEEINTYVAELLKAPDIIHSNIETYVLTEYDSADTLNYLTNRAEYPTSPRSNNIHTIGTCQHNFVRNSTAVQYAITLYVVVSVNWIDQSTLHELGHSAINYTSELVNCPPVSIASQNAVINYYNYSDYYRDNEWYAETYSHFINDPIELSTVAPEAYTYFTALHAALAEAKNRNELYEFNSY